MIEVKAVQEVCGELGYRITVDDGGMYITDGISSILVDLGDCQDVIKAIVDTYEEYIECRAKM